MGRSSIEEDHLEIASTQLYIIGGNLVQHFHEIFVENRIQIQTFVSSDVTKCHTHLSQWT